jgi:hypothetical protein
MIDPINAASASAVARLSQTTAPARSAATRGGAGFAGQLARLTASSSTTVKAETRPDNEHTKKITGHPYSRIENGTDKGMYLNQLDGSPREGAVFKLVKRDDRVFHVYGAGQDRVIVEVKKKDAATPDGSTGGATPATT